MAFSTLTFTKSWENAADFPTYEENEQQVRADLQYLHDEMRDAFNALVARLNDAAVAGDLPIAPVEGLSAATVQEAIEETLAQIQNTAAGQIVNGSITKEKLSTALLERVYGGKMLLAWDSPDESDNPNTDCPLGQLWLRPALTIPNDAAGKTWQKSGCTVEEAGGAFTVTADGTMASAGVSQSFTGLGQAGQAALVHLTLPSHDAGLNTLRVYLNGVETALPEDGWMAASLQSAGALEVQIQGTWPSAQAAGYFTIGDFTVVTVGALEAALPGCTPPGDWKALLTPLLPFTKVRLPQVLYLQTAPGVWQVLIEEILPVARGGTGLSTVAQGALLFGGAGSLTALSPAADGAVLQCFSGAPVWRTREEATADLGHLRCKTGSYTGNGKARTINLPVTPLAVLLHGTDKQFALLLPGMQVEQRLSAPESAPGGGIPYYYAGMELQGSTLSTWMNATQTAQECGATPSAWNTAGQHYSYLAIY